jgi:hypothetical protein
MGSAKKLSKERRSPRRGKLPGEKSSRKRKAPQRTALRGEGL